MAPVTEGRIEQGTKVNITKRVVDALPFSNGSQVIYWDKALPGFGIRVGASRKTFIAQKKVNGRDVKVGLGAHGVVMPEHARRKAAKALSDMANRINPNAQKRAEELRGMPLAKVFEDYKADRKTLKPLTLRDYNNIMSGFFHDWKNRPIIEITRGEVLHRHKKIGEGKGGKARANLSMRFLRSLFNYAIGRYLDGKGKPLVTDNPVKVLSHARAWYRVERRQTLIKAYEIPLLFDAMDKLDKEAITPPHVGNGAGLYSVYPLHWFETKRGGDFAVGVCGFQR